METVIARDTDIIREYIAALDGREQGISPFAKFASVTKLAKLRRQLNSSQIESTDDDLTELRRQINERISRTGLRRFVAKPWGSRIVAVATIILGQQIVLAALWLLTRIFIRFAPVPKRWNPVLPHEQPGFLYLFVFAVFFVTPMLATLVVFGGRYFRSWRYTLPATLLLIILSIVLTVLVVKKPDSTNPVKDKTSLQALANSREETVSAYRDWAAGVWLLRDADFQRDYETYLRSGPGRWITSRLVSDDDQAWQPRSDDNDSLKVISAYLDTGQDQNGFREWLKYYLDRHRIYSSDRIDQEVSTLTSSANQRYLGLWQMEPYLKERDRRLYRSYLGTVDSSMKRWGLIWMGVLIVVFLTGYLLDSFLRPRAKSSNGLMSDGSAGSRTSLSGYSFPESTEIVTTPFFSTPFKLFSSVHRGFLRLTVLCSIFVFLFWGAVYAFGLSGEQINPATQTDLMRSSLLVGGSPEGSLAPDVTVKPTTTSVTYVTVGRATNSTTAGSTTGADKLAASQAGELQKRLDESDYASSKQFKEQGQALATQHSEIRSVRDLTAQLQQNTNTLPDQLNDLGSRANAAEARAGQVGTEAEAARQTAEQVNTKLKDVEARASRAADQVGRVESQMSMLATRTESMDKEFEQRARQIEARTEELGERTAGLKESGDRLERIQTIAFTAILAELNASTNDLDRRVSSSFYRSLNKAEAHHDAELLLQRISSLTAELKELKTEQAGTWITELDALTKRVQDINARIK